MSVNINVAPNDPMVEFANEIKPRDTEKILRGERLRENGGIGWALLRNIGIGSPEPQNFRIEDCMREEEINETWSSLQRGNKVWWEGGDGYGKSTFLGEFQTFIVALNESRRPEDQIRIEDLSVITHGKIENLEFHREKINFLTNTEVGKKVAKNTLYVIDSADYVWEQTGGIYMSPLTKERVALFKALLESPCMVLMTAHDKESKNKKVDEFAKMKATHSMTINGVEKHKLSPLYPEDKVNSLFKSLGLHPEIVDILTSKLFLPIRHHGVLSNYVINGPETYSISYLLNWVKSKLDTGELLDFIAKDIEVLLSQRNVKRIQDWLTIGF